LPLSGLGSLTGLNEQAAIHVSEEALKIRAFQRRPNHKIFLLTSKGQTLEAPADLYPERPLEMALLGESRMPAAVVIQDENKSPVFAYHRVESLTLEPSVGPYLTAAGKGYDPSDPEPVLRAATMLPADRSIAHMCLGVQAIVRGDFAGADHRFEQALLFNGEDHLSWIAKAIVQRLLGDEQEEKAELLNAHYLAPLEPLLRAESFLSQPVSMVKDASPLLRPLQDVPEAFVEVAAFLLHLGLFEQASRWIDEALRHVDLAMLRYLQAYCLLEASKMKAEAAAHVAAAAKIPFAPPLPWRTIELQALDRLKQAFPEDARLADYFKLADK
jgi:tetratricopeptide (TPR) repeat protein